MTAARVALIDVETYRTRDPRLVDMITREAIDKIPAQNTKTELKAGWHAADARDRRARDALAKTSLDVLYAEILCVGVILDDQPAVCYTAMWPGESEAGMLAELAEALRAQTSAETIWAGHNVDRFDFPILLNRWRRFGVVPPESFPQPHAGKMRGRIYDTMLRTPSGNGLGFVSLHDASLAYGLPEPKSTLCLEADRTPMSGAIVARAFELGEFATIEAYNLEDMASIRALYNACTFDGAWGTWNTDDELEAAIKTVWAQVDMQRGQQAELILEILAGTGKIPRRFAGIGS